MTLRECVARAERECILETLARFRGNRTVTAIALGVSLRGLHYKLERYAAEGVAVTPGQRGGRRPKRLA